MSQTSRSANSSSTQAPFKWSYPHYLCQRVDISNDCYSESTMASYPRTARSATSYSRSQKTVRVKLAARISNWQKLRSNLRLIDSTMTLMPTWWRTYHMIRLSAYWQTLRPWWRRRTIGLSKRKWDRYLTTQPRTSSSLRSSANSSNRNSRRTSWREWVRDHRCPCRPKNSANASNRIWRSVWSSAVSIKQVRSPRNSWKSTPLNL